MYIKFENSFHNTSFITAVKKDVVDFSTSISVPVLVALDILGNGNEKDQYSKRKLNQIEKKLCHSRWSKIPGYCQCGSFDSETFLIYVGEI